MANNYLELHKEDVIRILAGRYEVDIKNIDVTISPAYDGGPLEFSPATVKVTIKSPKRTFEDDNC